MTTTNRPGFLIIFEGVDGTGKTTQLELLAENLRQNNYSVVATREPTDGIYGKKIRHLYSHRDQYSKDEELELFIADRKDHIESVIIPALHSGKIVLCDRYYLSTAAYQGVKGHDPETILQMNSFAPTPDLALIFQIDIKESISRITTTRGDTLNDFEQKESLQIVAKIFNSINRPYIKYVDAKGSIVDVQKRVLHHVTELLAQNHSYKQD